MNIPLYVATYDDFVYAIRYKSGNTKICLSKKIGDGRVLVIETVSKSHGSIEFKNMIGVSEEKYLEEYEKRYKKRNGTNTGGSESSNNSPRDETASNTIIPENSEKSNTFEEKSLERSALSETAESELSKTGISDEKRRQPLEMYSENNYNSFGWARAENALSINELDDLYAKIQARTTLRTFKRSSRGEAIIEVNNKPKTTLGVDNVFVFVKGTKSDFVINRVVRFRVETETEMEILKEDLYEGRTCSDTHIALYQAEGLAREYRREDFPTFAAYREGRSNGETSRRTHQDNRGRAKYRSGYSLALGEDGKRFVMVEIDQAQLDGLSIKEQTDLATRVIKNVFKVRL